MSASLVGSEMCIRDRAAPFRPLAMRTAWADIPASAALQAWAGTTLPSACLLYTSDAADDM
eukprot:10606000-Alexandrium_andersonii.AAC.1